MSGKRENLQKALSSYITDTFKYIHTVNRFCERFSSWRDKRDAELTKLKRKINQEQLDAVLKDTLGGLEELHGLLDAVEKLGVTSPHVFMVGNQVLHLPKGISPVQVQFVIHYVQTMYPFLLEFKRDAKVFFQPKRQNVEVLACQLEIDILIIEMIFGLFQTASCDISLNTIRDTVVDLRHFSEDNIQRMLRHIKHLNEIRTDQDFRMVFLFQDVSCSDFSRKFSERRPRMLKSLRELEECAVQLDRMNKGAKISSVAGSSVGAIGAILSIVGLVLTPVTGGVSLALTAGGAALGATSGVNSIVTNVTEANVNYTQQEKATELFKNFMDDVQSLQCCLMDVMYQMIPKIDRNPFDAVLREDKVAFKIPGIVMSTKSCATNVSALKGGGQATGGGSLALSKSAMAGFGMLNGLFLGMNIFFICKDGMSLAEGSESEVSKLIRARSTLWRSEIDSWQKICDSLTKGLQTSEKHKAALETPFYPRQK